MTNEIDAAAKIADKVEEEALGTRCPLRGFCYYGAHFVQFQSDARRAFEKVEQSHAILGQALPVMREIPDRIERGLERGLTALGQTISEMNTNLVQPATAERRGVPPFLFLGVVAFLVVFMVLQELRGQPTTATVQGPGGSLTVQTQPSAPAN